MSDEQIIEEIAIRFPSGCSYIAPGGEKINNVKWDRDRPWKYNTNCFAIRDGAGLVYMDGKWATRTDIPQEPQYEIY